MNNIVSHFQAACEEHLRDACKVHTEAHRIMLVLRELGSIVTGGEDAAAFAILDSLRNTENQHYDMVDELIEERQEYANPADTVTVFIRSLTGRHTPIRLQKTDNILLLRFLLFREHGFPIVSYDLIFNGKLVKSYEVIEDLLDLIQGEGEPLVMHQVIRTARSSLVD